MNNNADLAEVINELNRMTDTVNVDVSNINNVTNQLTEVLINGAKSCGMVTQTNSNFVIVIVSLLTAHKCKIIRITNNI